MTDARPRPARATGLGKTIEVMALLMLHRSPPARTLVVESHTAQVTAARCRQVKATLIVSPESLITQWKDELEGHSPGLRVLVYNGYKSLPFKISTEEEVERARQQRELAARRAAERERVQYVLSSSEDEAADNDVRPGGKRKAKSKGKGGAGSRAASKQPKQAARDEEGDESLWWDYLDADGGYDVVLCSYATLDRDLAVAAQPKQRPRRGGVEYDKTLKPRSPLVMVEWWRLAMDEVRLPHLPRGAGSVRRPLETDVLISPADDPRSSCRARRASRRWSRSCRASTRSRSAARPPSPGSRTSGRRCSPSLPSSAALPQDLA